MSPLGVCARATLESKCTEATKITKRCKREPLNAGIDDVADAKGSMSEPMRCRRCGDVIGYYEPLVMVEPGQVRTTSAAAEPQLNVAPGERFHPACYAEAHSVSTSPLAPRRAAMSSSLRSDASVPRST